MANAKGKSIDGTHLSMDLAKDHMFTHRDYLAHCFRWSYVLQFMHTMNRYKTSHLLDIGCGREVPLARALFSGMMTHTTGSYTGVDYNKLKHPHSLPEKTDKWHMKLLGESDFLKVELPRKTYDVIVSFEMLEHVEPNHAFTMLQRMRELIVRGGDVFLSTPCYDAHVGHADNHVNEMSYLAFHALVHLAGFDIERVYGTFASQKDYKKLLTPGQREVFEALNEYYDANLISNIFAPMFPAQSRNCLWHLKPGKPIKPDIDTIKLLSKPEHGSSTHWVREFKKIVKSV